MIKRFVSILLFSSSSLVAASAADPTTPQDQQLTAAITDIRTQQAQIADNQAKIEAKLATIAEAVRVARIYSSRAGH